MAIFGKKELGNTPDYLIIFVGVSVTQKCKNIISHFIETNCTANFIPEQHFAMPNF